MAYSWDNRVKFVVRYMYDIDNNGYLDKNDFECLALRNTLIECRGNWDEAAYAKNKVIMGDLWNEIANLADFNKDDQGGELSVQQFSDAVRKICRDKPYAGFPNALKTVIDKQHRLIDLNGDGLVGIDEYRLDCVSRAAFSDIKEIDDAYNSLLSEEDRAVEGISLTRYQDLYAQFISNPDEKCNAVYLFGPLSEV